MAAVVYEYGGVSAYLKVWLLIIIAVNYLLDLRVIDITQLVDQLSLSGELVG